MPSVPTAAEIAIYLGCTLDSLYKRGEGLFDYGCIIRRVAPITSARRNRNIYQTARELRFNTGILLECLNVSVESLGAYEQDRRLSAGQHGADGAAVRFPMSLLSAYPGQATLRECFTVGVRTLERNHAAHIRLISRFAKDGRLDQLLEINETASLPASRSVTLHDEIMSELHAIVTAALELDFASEELRMANLPRIQRSAKEAADERKLDPRHKFCEHHIRYLIRSGAHASYLRQAAASFINLDTLIEVFNAHPMLDLLGQQQEQES